MSIYIDSNIFIFAALGAADDPRTARSKDILESVIEGKEVAFTSLLTVDEVVWVIIKQKKDRQLAVGQGLRMHQLPIRLIPLTETISMRALHLMKKYPHLSPRDSLHVSSCIDVRASNLVSDDSDFKDIKEIAHQGID
ncbi:MAG: type II toxin-antitoxin system VapC family toxin [Nanoarchaeota archaeon]